MNPTTLLNAPLSQNEPARQRQRDVSAALFASLLGALGVDAWTGYHPNYQTENFALTETGTHRGITVHTNYDGQGERQGQGPTLQSVGLEQTFKGITYYALIGDSEPATRLVPITGDDTLETATARITAAISESLAEGQSFFDALTTRREAFVAGLAARGAAIAAVLPPLAGESWTGGAVPVSDYQDEMRIMLTAGPVKIYAMAASKGRYHDCLHWVADMDAPYQAGTLPSINNKIDRRTEAQIGGDIARRMLPQIGVSLSAERERIDKNTREDARMTAFAREVERASKGQLTATTGVSHGRSGRGAKAWMNYPSDRKALVAVSVSATPEQDPEIYERYESGDFAASLGPAYYRRGVTITAELPHAASLELIKFMQQRGWLMASDDNSESNESEAK